MPRSFFEGLHTMMTTNHSWSLNTLASCAESPILNSSGFFEKPDVEIMRRSGLHSYLIANCTSPFFLDYLRGGLQHWSRQLEYPYILVQVAKYAAHHQHHLASVPLKVFDNACGVNATAYLLASLGLDLQGTDLNDQPSAEGVLPSEAWTHYDIKTLCGAMQFQAADSLRLPFADDHFDVSYSISSLEHMPDSVKAIAEMVRVTKPGGLITFTMDVAPYQAAVGAESNVNATNFASIQSLIIERCVPFATARWNIPGTEISWASDCRRSSGLRLQLSRAMRRWRGMPKDLNFYVFAGSWIKR